MIMEHGNEFGVSLVYISVMVRSSSTTGSAVAEALRLF
jgi:hypothetical protein